MRTLYFSTKLLPERIVLSFFLQGEEGSDEYGGPKPFSEPETRIVKLIAETTRPQAFVNLHSGEYAVYVPWDSKKGLAPDLPADIGNVLEQLDAYCQCMHGAAGDVAGYAEFVGLWL